MTDPKEFQQERREWSRWKHAILDGYLKRFSGILQRHETIYVVDGFAGPGRYIDDGEDGSPLLAARIAKSTQERRYQLRCINVEKEAEIYRNLCTATADFGELVTNLEGAFGDHIDEILGWIDDKPTLFFLDPMGLKGLERGGLLPVFQRFPTAVTELLIRFDISIAQRLRGFIASNAKQSEANIRILMEVFGFESLEDLRACLREYPDNPDGIAEAYQDRLKSFFDHVLRIPIRKRQGQLKYYLLFATRSLKGVVAMNDTLFEVEGMREEDLASWKNRQDLGIQLSMFEPSPADKLRSELEVIKQETLNVLSIGTNIRRDDLRAKIALRNDYFGAFSGSHFTAVLGGRPRGIEMPDGFVPLSRDRIRITAGTPGSDNATLYRVE